MLQGGVLIVLERKMGSRKRELKLEPSLMERTLLMSRYTKDEKMERIRHEEIDSRLHEKERRE